MPKSAIPDCKERNPNKMRGQKDLTDTIQNRHSTNKPYNYKTNKTKQPTKRSSTLAINHPNHSPPQSQKGQRQ